MGDRCGLVNSIVTQLMDGSEKWPGERLYFSREGSVTYGQMSKAMLATAGWLTDAYDIRAQDRVAVCLPVSIVSAQVIFGILACGASYLPMHFNGPVERLVEVVASSKPKILITTSAMAKKLAQQFLQTGSIELVVVSVELSGFNSLIGSFPSLAKPLAVQPHNLAAIFFTSGSTGEPKGVMMSHESMAVTTGTYANYAPLHQSDRLIMLAPLHYAASLGMFFPLPSGSSSYLAAEEESMFPDIVAQILEREQITLWEAASTRLRVLAENVQTAKLDLRAMRFVMFYGERIPLNSLRRAMDVFHNALFRNIYAASEAFWMMSYEVPRPLSETLGELPIGKPRMDYRLSLLDDDGCETAPGKAGEICVVGPVGIVGYWGRPDLTDASRVSGIINSFRTGDLARLGADENYVFAGRLDHQVKIRGHRFELGEIETVLKLHPAVRDAVAILSNDNIHAFILAEDYEDWQNDILALCVRKLPLFAKPTSLHLMAAFPLLPSGKVDRMTLQGSVQSKSSK